MQVFLDDFNAPRMCPEAELEEELGKPAALQLMQHEAAAGVGATYSETKRVCGQLVVERLGALVDGVVGRLSAPEAAIISAGYFAM